MGISKKSRENCIYNVTLVHWKNYAIIIIENLISSFFLLALYLSPNSTQNLLFFYPLFPPEYDRTREKLIVTKKIKKNNKGSVVRKKQDVQLQLHAKPLTVYLFRDDHLTFLQFIRFLIPRFFSSSHFHTHDYRSTTGWLRHATEKTETIGKP